ncbi:MAG: hypothetical protein H0U89_08245, partial [Acidimicrobiia bacterium]|nr:hypothetical protein [Acidimicrobiia bacterium]
MTALADLLRRASKVQLDALAVGVLAGLVLGLVSRDEPWVAALTLVLAGALTVRVAVPWGGHIPLGFA